MLRWKFLRDFEAGRYLDLMLAAAVTAVLLIRFSLALTGYPKLGGSYLHVAHVLWGGLLMLVAMVMLLSSLGRGMHSLAAVIGGAGFGTFIDEVGKFITHDNDYFYQPAVSIIYAIFGLLYLGLRSFHRERAGSQAEHLANALEFVTELAVGNLDRGERDRAQRHLRLAAEEFPFARDISAILTRAQVTPPRRPGWFARLSRALVAGYDRLAAAGWFGRGLVAFFLIQLLLKLLRLTALAHLLPAQGQNFLAIPLFSTLPVSTQEYTLVHWMQLASSLLAGIYIALGFFYVFRHRVRALRMFLRATQVTIFLSQVFVFYHVEWWGLGELAFNLLLLVALRFAIDHENDPAIRPGPAAERH